MLNSEKKVGRKKRGEGYEEQERGRREGGRGGKRSKEGGDFGGDVKEGGVMISGQGRKKKN